MTNEYYNADVKPVRQTLGRAERISGILESIAAGFDKLPAPAVLQQDRGNFVTASGPANAYTATLSTTLTAYTSGLKIFLF